MADEVAERPGLVEPQDRDDWNFCVHEITA